MKNLGYYIYGLVDPTELKEGVSASNYSNVLASIFYVGKGSGYRMDSHLEQVQSEMELISSESGLLGRKARKILSLLENGIRPKSVKLVADLSDENEAYRVESFAIEAVNAMRGAFGRDPLTNAVKGHGVAMEDMDNFMNRLEVEDLIVDFTADELSILVKGTAEDLVSCEYIENPDGSVIDYIEFPLALKNKIAVMSEIEGSGVSRRGWDVTHPWTNDEARARASRFWPLGKDQVSSWLSDSAGAPRYLMLGIEEGKSTVVRFVFPILRDEKWEYYPGGQNELGTWKPRWGLPLGDPVVEHPYLNRVLKQRNTNGQTTQVLHGYAGGIRVANF